MLETTTALHLANRLGFGPAPGDLDRIQQDGFEGYIEKQLNARVAELPASLQAQLHKLPVFGKNTADMFRGYWYRARIRDASGAKLPRDQIKMIQQLTAQVGPQVRMARLLRAIASPYRLHESLVDFWFNHFNVYEHKALDRVWTGPYEEEAIRAHALGKFSDLLLATAKHPAMLVYLDNWKNVAPGVRGVHGKTSGINENYAREVMELHTLGVDGGYTQSDVTALAHVLTGWTVGADRSGAHPIETQWKGGAVHGGFAFRPRWHDTTPQTVLSRRFPNRDQSDGEAALLMLAHHPSTARHISFKLAQYFVADQPAPGLINAMTATFKGTDGDIKAVVRTMLTSSEFRDKSNFGRKLKTPYQYVISVARVTGLDPQNAAPLGEELKALGQPIYSCLTPDGYACTESAWLDSDAMVRRISFAVKFGTGAYMRPYLARAGYGTMNKNIQPQPEDGNAPLDSRRLMDVVGAGLSEKTKAAVARTAEKLRAGLILGSPDFMRC